MWMRSSSTPMLGLCVLATIAGCDGGNGGDTAPMGTRLLSGRDFGNLFFWNPSTLAFTRQRTDGDNQDLWVWPTDEGAPLVALPYIDWSPPTQWDRLLDGDILMTGRQGELIYDLQARSPISFAIEGEDPSLVSPSFADYTAIRPDGGAILARRSAPSALLVGRGAGLLPSITGFVVNAVDFMGTDLVILGHPASDPLAPDQIHLVALPSGQASPLPVSSFDADSTTANRAASLCLGFADHPCQLFRVFGCHQGDLPCPDTGRAPCSILYQRGGEGARQLYAYDVVTGDEHALPGGIPTDFLPSPDQHRVAWIPTALNRDNTEVYFHDFCSGSTGQCAVPLPWRLTWRDDGDFLIAAIRGPGGGPGGGPGVATVSFPGGIS